MRRHHHPHAVVRDGRLVGRRRGLALDDRVRLDDLDRDDVRHGADVGFVVVGLALALDDRDAGGQPLHRLDAGQGDAEAGALEQGQVVEHLVEDHGSEVVTLNLKMADAETAAAVEPLFAKIGLTTSVEANNLMVNGDLATIFGACLDDADAAYHNRGEEIEAPEQPINLPDRTGRIACEQR